MTRRPLTGHHFGVERRDCHLSDDVVFRHHCVRGKGFEPCESFLVEHALSLYALGLIDPLPLHGRGLNDTSKVESGVTRIVSPSAMILATSSAIFPMAVSI